MDKKYLKNSLGFSLLELTAVVAVIGLSIMLMAPIYGEQANGKKVIKTRAVMESIRIAVLGKRCEGVRGDIKFAGYVPDMGGLPELIDQKSKAAAANGQPAGLWRINPLGTPSGRLAKKFKIMKLTLGWQGPYITPPTENIIKDAWNRPLIFTRFDITKNRESISKHGANLKMISLGADGLPGGTGPAEDLQMIIRDNDYLSRVAGYIPADINVKDEYYYGTDPEAVGSVNIEKRTLTPPKQTMVKIYYGRSNLLTSGTPSAEDLKNIKLLKFKKVEMAENGYFRFDQQNRIPRGVERLLMVTQEVESTGYEANTTYKIHVAGSLCWLGRLAPH